MKKGLFLFLLAAVIMLPLESFALVDGEVYGGYTFSGEVDGTSMEDVTGFSYGARAHYTTSFLIVTFGIGPYLQYAPLNVEMNVLNNTIEADMNKMTIGLDVYNKFDVPLVPLKPYLRYGLAMYDKTTVTVDSTETSESKYFQMYYGGLGLALTAIPVPIVDFQIFTEYLYEYSKISDDDNLKGHKVNLGVSVGI